MLTFLEGLPANDTSQCNMQEQFWRRCRAVMYTATTSHRFEFPVPPPGRLVSVRIIAALRGRRTNGLRDCCLHGLIPPIRTKGRGSRRVNKLENSCPKSILGSDSEDQHLSFSQTYIATSLRPGTRHALHDALAFKPYIFSYYSHYYYYHDE